MKEHVSVAHCCHEEIRFAVVINVGKGGGDADPVLERNGGLVSDVLKFAFSQIAPELIAALLVHEVDIEKPVSVHVRDRHAGPMIVMRCLERLARIVHHIMLKSES